MTEMFGEAWPPMSVPDLAPDDDDDDDICLFISYIKYIKLYYISISIYVYVISIVYT